MAEAAIVIDSNKAKRTASGYLADAISLDQSDTRLLALLVSFYLDLKEDNQAQVIYDQFKRVARASPLANKGGFRVK